MIREDLSQLTQAGIIAIPLKEQLSLGLKPFPNFLIFENQFGKNISPFVNLFTNEIEQTPCVQTIYKLVQREILEPNEIYPNRTFMERVLLPNENLSIPVQLLAVFFTHQSIKDNLQIVNLALSKFSFRGALEGLILEVDEDVLDQILEPNVE